MPVAVDYYVARSAKVVRLVGRGRLASYRIYPVCLYREIVNIRSGSGRVLNLDLAVGGSPVGIGEPQGESACQLSAAA